MTNCLDGVVGIYCPDGTMPSAADEPLFYLQELPGINLARAAMTADQETTSGVALMMKALNFAGKIVKADFIQRLRKEKLFLPIVGQEVVGVIGTNFPGIGADYDGFKFEMVADDRFISGDLEYIELKADQAVSGASIYYQVDNLPAASFTTDIQVGYNKIRINNLSFKQALKIWIDRSQISIADGTMTANRLNCIPSCSDLVCGDCVTWVRITGTAGDPQNVTWAESSVYPGISAMIVCKTDAEELICPFREDLAAAILYRSGAYLMEEQISSGRNNPEIRNTREEAKELYARWMGGTDPQTGFQIKGEYPRLIQQVVESAISLFKNSGSRAFVNKGLIMGDAVTPAGGVRRRTRIFKPKF